MVRKHLQLEVVDADTLGHSPFEVSDMSALNTLHQQNARLSGAHGRPITPAARRVEVLPNPDLTTELMVFRPLGLGDRLVFLDALRRSKAALVPWIPLGMPEESDESYFESMVMRSARGDADQSAWRRAAFLNDGRFVGMFNIIKIERGLSWSAEANWWVDQSLGGRGLGTHACRAMVDYALADVPVGLGLHTLRANIGRANGVSMRLAQKIGFVCSGQREQLEINNAIVDHEVLVCSAA